MKKWLAIFIVSVNLLLISPAVFSDNTVAIDSTAAGFNQFAFQIFQHVNQQNKNIVLSPYSLASVLAILSSSTAGDTQQQLLHLLHIVPQTKNVNSVLKAIDTSIQYQTPCNTFWICTKKHVQNWLGLASDTAVVTANALWAQTGLHYKKAAVEKINALGNVEFKEVDYTRNSDQVRQLINDWASAKTAGKIKELMPAGQPDKLTRLILINAIYFKGNWQYPFKTADTSAAPFMNEDGQTIQVSMMQQQHTFRYSENEAVQLLEMPYAHVNLAMVLLLPKPKHTLNEITKKLNNTYFFNLLNAANDSAVDVKLPKFTLSASYNDLKTTLQDLGLTVLFSPLQADFSALTQQSLYVDNIIQKTYLAVDETGTTAAAATATTLFGTAFHPPKIFHADHPFILVIYDRVSKIILFTAKVADL